MSFSGRGTGISPDKINLLYVITKLELGGAQTHLLNLIRGLDRQKFNIYLFTARDGMLMADALAIEGLNVVPSPLFERRIDPLRDLFTFIALYFFIKRNKIGLVHTHSSKAGVIGRLAAGAAGVKRVIHTVHGWSFHDHQPAPVRWAYRLLEKFCARLTHRLIVVSEHDKRRGLEHRILPLEGYSVVSCGIRPDDYGISRLDDKARLELGLSGSGPVVGMVACFKPQKAPIDFIDLAVELKKALPSVKFVLAGDGVLREAISARIRQAGLNGDIILAGWRRDIPFVLSVLDVFVLTSKWEGLPVAVLEAMAAGAAVVATDTGGIREVITAGETGYLVRPGDINGLRDKVLALINAPQLRDGIARRAAAFVRQPAFSLDHGIRKIEELYLNPGMV